MKANEYILTPAELSLIMGDIFPVNTTLPTEEQLSQAILQLKRLHYMLKGSWGFHSAMEKLNGNGSICTGYYNACLDWNREDAEGRFNGIPSTSFAVAYVWYCIWDRGVEAPRKASTKVTPSPHVKGSDLTFGRKGVDSAVTGKEMFTVTTKHDTIRHAYYTLALCHRVIGIQPIKNIRCNSLFSAGYYNAAIMRGSVPLISSYLQQCKKLMEGIEKVNKLPSSWKSEDFVDFLSSKKGGVK